MEVTNTKFRSTAQAIGRVAAIFRQRFTSDSTKVALISFQVKGLRVASYRIDLVGVTKDQFNPNQEKSYQQSIDPIDLVQLIEMMISKVFGCGPYLKQTV